MNKPQQAVFDSKLRRIKRKAIYIPPHSTVLQALAENVGTVLKSRGEATYEKPDTVHDLYTFLATVARLTAKSMTEGKVDWLNRKPPK